MWERQSCLSAEGACVKQESFCSKGKIKDKLNLRLLVLFLASRKLQNTYPHAVRFFPFCYNADFVLCMFCRTIFDTKKLLEFARLGCYLEYDLFGTEFLHYQFHPDIDMPSDNERIARYLLLCSLSYSITIDKLILLVLVLSTSQSNSVCCSKLSFSY